MKLNKPVTQADIAKRVGVSQRAVASVVGKGSARIGVSAETREKILAVARELGYRPHRGAQLMTGAASGMIGLVKSVTELQHAQLKYLHLGEAVARRGYKLISIDVLWNYSGLEEGLSFLSDMRVEGLFVGGSSSTVGNHPLIHEFTRNEVPVVHFDVSERSLEPGVHSVVADNAQGMRELVEQLLARGYRRITMVQRENPTHNTSLERMQGYETAMRAAGLSPDHVAVSNADIGGTLDTYIDMGRRGMETLLTRSRLPEVVCFGNDLYAMGALACCARHGISVPGEVNITGFDNNSFGAQHYPSLSSVEQPIREIAESSADLMAGLIRGELDRNANHYRRHPCRVHLCGTTAPAPSLSRTAS